MYFEEVTLESKLHSKSTPCFGCLSTTRKLLVLGDYASVFCNLFENEYSAKSSDVVLCWECMALLRKVKLFKEKVAHAQTLLSNHMLYSEINISPDGLSNLKLAIETTSCDETLHEFLKCDEDEKQIDIKDETPDEDLGENLGYEDNIINDEYDEENNGIEYKTKTKNFENILNPKNVTKQEVVDTVTMTKQKVAKKVTKQKVAKNVTKQDVANNKKQKLGYTQPPSWKRSLCGIDVKHIVKNEKRKNKHKNLKLDVQSDEEEEKRVKKIDEAEEDPDFKWYNLYKYNTKPQSDGKNVKPKKVLPYKYLYNKTGFTRIPMSLDEVVSWMEKERKSDYFTKPMKLKYNCEICLKIIPNEKKKITSHNQLHRMIKYFPFPCVHCKLVSATAKGLAKHIEIHHNNIVQCNTCHFQCYSESYMEIHKRKHVSSLQCQHCMAVFPTKAEFFKHFCVCDHCDKRFRTKQKLEQHFIKTHLPYHCKVCDTRVKPGGYSDHMTLKHTPEGLEEAYCVACDKQFLSRTYYERHVENSLLHAKERPERVERKKYPCSDCDKTLSSAQAIRHHHARVHLNQSWVRPRPYVRSECELCGKVYKNRNALKRHMNAVHVGIREHACDYCQRRFTTKSILVNHIRTHTGERPFHCEYCDAKFAQRTAMRQHVKFVHLKATRRVPVVATHGTASSSYQATLF